MPSVHHRLRRRVALALALASGLSFAACTKTETVVREGPASNAAATPDGSMAFADPAGAAGEVTRVAGGVDPDTVSGVPGTPVDCALTLPCRWSSEGGGFSVTVTSGDDTGPRHGLSLAFRVDTLHDTELAFGGGAEVLDARGMLHTPILRALGAGNGNAPQGVAAGAGVEGRIDHAAPAGETYLTRVRLGLLDNGLAREAAFTNVPLGPDGSLAADCAFALPCTWTSSDGRATVELLTVGGLADLRRLTAGFTVTTDDGSGVAFDGAGALGADGTTFSSRTHALGNTRGFEPVTATSVADIPLAGTVDFHRTTAAPATLRSLTLALYPDAPVPRWKIVFESVPLL